MSSIMIGITRAGGPIGWPPSLKMLPQPAYDLLSDRAVQAYFLVLGLAIRRCLRRYFQTLPASSPRRKGKDPEVPAAASHTSSTSSTILPLLLSATIVGITWYLILRFILANLRTSESYFDDAYKDVLRTPGNYVVSTQLLTWAMVAVVWSADAGCDVAFLLFGFLGAMSASYVLWVPTLYRRGRDDAGSSGGGGGGDKAVTTARRRRRRTVPASYVVSSVVAFVSILKLYPCTTNDDDDDDDADAEECTPDQGFGSFHLHFRRWLQVLHVVLVVPVFLSYILPQTTANRMMRVDSSVLFGLLSVGISTWHLYQVGVQGTTPSIPRTDCQLSITTDLVCCTLLTLYAVYRDSSSASSASTSSAAALRYTGIAALAIPLLSPAAVLAGHLCLCRLPDSYAALVGHVQRRVAAHLRRAEDNPVSSNNRHATWCNLGLWTKAPNGDGLCSYNQACENLAEALGQAAGLGAEDGVLSCGCGSMDEVAYYKDRFALRHITGIDPGLPEARRTHAEDFNVRTIRAGVEDLDNGGGDGDGDGGTGTGTGRRSMFPPRFFNKILALDNMYHYPDKEGAWRAFFGMVSPGGNVAVSDVLLKQRRDDTPLWVRIALRLMGMPTTNLWTDEEYRRRLAEMGYDGVDVQTISEPVLIKGWSRFLPRALLRHLDYAIIVASSPVQVQPRPKKKKIAIVGSGLAGLSAAHYLLSSSRAADLDVDIYEANDCPGLAGNTTLIGGQLVDVPARMAALGYYTKYTEILEELGIPTAVVKTDCSFYGSDGNGGHVCHCYDKSSAVNVYTAIFVGGLRRLCNLLVALSKMCDDHAPIDPSGDASQTFGDWLRENLGLSSDRTFKCKHTGKDKTHDLPSLTCYDNPFAYIMVGSLSWMLSCTWEQLAKYPADIVLPYLCGLKMDRLGIGRKGQVIRISPSIKVLERALLYGVNKLQCGSRVMGVDGKRTIDGTAYDVIVCAAEARAVPKIIKNSSEMNIFGQIEYHPSTIYLHRDESFMPRNKKEWRTWNVEMSSGRKEPQLTFWLNEFYPDAEFDGNVFQTWSPTHQPQAELIIRRSDFERVVHSSNSRSIISEIENLQGKDSIFFAGSYSAYGMGLLEEALISGRKASDRVLVDIQ